MFPQRLIFLAAALFSFGGLNAQIDLPQEEADKHHTNLLVMRLKQQLGKIVPRKHCSLPGEEQCLIHFPGSMSNPAFSINATSYPIRIYPPHHFHSWVFNKKNLLPFVHAHLTARTGIREPLKDIWISAAVIQEIFEPGTIYGAEGFGDSPFARTMLAHGFTPSPDIILNSTMDDFYGTFTSAARMEWCSLLLKLALRKNSSWEYILVKENDLSPSQKFEKLLFPEKNKQKKKTVFARKKRNLQDWFFPAVSNMVLNRGIPCSVPWLEENIMKIFDSIRQDLKIPENEMEGKERNETVRKLAHAEMKLNHLAMHAPERIALKLFRCSNAIQQFRIDFKNTEKLNLVHQEEKTLYLTLSERADLELVLKKAEQRLIPPGARFALTLKTAAPTVPEIPLLQKANQLMDHFEKDF